MQIPSSLTAHTLEQGYVICMQDLPLPVLFFLSHTHTRSPPPDWQSVSTSLLFHVLMENTAMVGSSPGMCVLTSTARSD